jgi:hypothetical protein
MADGEGAFLDAALSAGGPDPEELAHFVVHWNLLGWVEPALDLERARLRMPAWLLEGLDGARERMRARAKALEAESAEVHDALDRAGVEALILKGLSFGARFFGGTHRRYQHDLDLLVHARDKEAALVALEGRGFRREHTHTDDGETRLEMVRHDSPVDVHWNLRRRARRRVDEDELWSDTLDVEIGGRRYRTLSDENALAFMLISMCGDLRRGACQARHFLDLHLLLRGAGPRDWEAFLRRREARALGRPCVNVLAVYLVLWGTAPEHPELARAVERRARAVVIRDEAEALGLVERPRGSAESKAWYARAYPYDALAGWARRWSVDVRRTVSGFFPRPGAPRDVGELLRAAAETAP